MHLDVQARDGIGRNSGEEGILAAVAGQAVGVATPGSADSQFFHGLVVKKPQAVDGIVSYVANCD